MAHPTEGTAPQQADVAPHQYVTIRPPAKRLRTTIGRIVTAVERLATAVESGASSLERLAAAIERRFAPRSDRDRSRRRSVRRTSDTDTARASAALAKHGWMER